MNTMNARSIAISVAAGAAASLLTLSALSLSFGGILLSSLAQLPLFLVGLSIGVHSAAIAAASSVAIASILIRFEFGVFFGLIVAVPAIILVRQALLTRPGADGKTTLWYPPAGLLLVALGLTVAVAMTALPTAIWPEADQIARARNVLINLPTEFLPADMTPDAIDRMVRLSLSFLPGFLGIGFYVLLIVNAALAQFILVRTSHNLRPTPQLQDLALPGWFATGAAVAGVGALFPGMAGIIGGNLVLICAVGFLFAGLAVVHAMVRAWQARLPALIALYGALFLIAPTIIVIAMLGIVEPWAKLRERFAGPAPSL